MKALVRLLVILAVATASATAQTRTGDALRIYLVDVEGENATLFVSPSGESLLIDTGNGGANVQDNPTTDAFLDGLYRDLYSEARCTVVKPGDTVSLAGGVEVTVLASAGQVLQQPLPGAGGPNPYCADFERQAKDLSENAQSVGVHVAFGQFRGLHLGD